MCNENKETGKVQFETAENKLEEMLKERKLKSRVIRASLNAMLNARPMEQGKWIMYLDEEGDNALRCVIGECPDTDAPISAFATKDFKNYVVAELDKETGHTRLLQLRTEEGDRK